MSNEKVTDLPGVSSATLNDIIYAVQGGISVQETLQQIFNLSLANIVLHFAGNPNTNVAGVVYQLCLNTVSNVLYVCTASGTALTAVWTQVAPSFVSPLSSSQGGTGVVNPAIHTLAVAQGASNFNFIGPLTNGQLLIGNTGADPTPAMLTAGTNISISTGAGTITIDSIGAAGFLWTDVSSTSQLMSSNNGYIADNSSLITFTLPPISLVGDEISIIGKGTGLFSIAQGSGQQINVGSSPTTLGTGGSITSTNQFNSINLVCTVSNTIWTTRGAPEGTFTIV
jgi:hypothetical protein